MQHRDPVRPLPQPEAHHRHVELAPVATLVVLGPQSEHAVQRNIVEVAELVDDQLAGEAIDASWHRSVGGENGPSPGTFSAASKFRPVSMYSRMRSKPRKPAWPSLVWNTSGPPRR